MSVVRKQWRKFEDKWLRDMNSTAVAVGNMMIVLRVYFFEVLSPECPLLNLLLTFSQGK